MFVKSFGHQSQRQFVAHSESLLVGGSLVLEPDFDGADVEADALSKLTSSLVADVTTTLVLGTQLTQLVGAESSASTTTSTSTDRSPTYPRTYTYVTRE